MESEPLADTAAVISEKTRVEGQLQGNQDLIVDGYVKGVIQTGGDLHVSQTGNIEADIHADNVVIEGRICGNVFAQGHLEIRASGTMIGDIAAKAIDIKEGSSFEGRSRMIKSDLVRPASPNRRETT